MSLCVLCLYVCVYMSSLYVCDHECVCVLQIHRVYLFFSLILNISNHYYQRDDPSFLLSFPFQCNLDRSKHKYGVY